MSPMMSVSRMDRKHRIMKLEAFATVNILYLAIAGTIAMVSYISSNGVKKIYFADGIAILLPGILYSLIYIVRFINLTKALGNIIIEPLLIGIFSAATFALRLLISRKYPEYARGLSYIAIIVNCFIAVVIYMMFPLLKE